MSETPDRRRRTDLDLFVLALIESGISTPYELQKAAGLSQGATVPALQRLLESGFVRQGKPGLRGRTEYKVTAPGKRVLKTGWHGLMKDGPSGDLDADLRVALLAWWIGRDRRLAAEFLRRSADKKGESIDFAEEENNSDFLSPLAYWYSKLRSASAKALIEAESEAVRSLIEALPRKLSANRVRAKRITNLPK